MEFIVGLNFDWHWTEAVLWEEHIKANWFGTELLDTTE